MKNDCFSRNSVSNFFWGCYNGDFCYTNIRSWDTSYSSQLGIWGQYQQWGCNRACMCMYVYIYIYLEREIDVLIYNITIDKLDLYIYNIYIYILITVHQ